MLTKDRIYSILDEVCDPEIPVLTVRDLGVVRDINLEEDGTVEVIITPTYSGCPAMNAIEINIRAALQDAGIDQVKVTTILSPAWTTDWLSEEGKNKLKAYGIAPPQKSSYDKNLLFSVERNIKCPRCQSTNTEMISQFGSTACKAMHKCNDCKEPFDYFKCH